MSFYKADSHSVVLRFYFSRKLSGDSDTAGPWTIL